MRKLLARNFLAIATLAMALPATGFSASPDVTGAELTLAAQAAKASYIIDGASWSCAETSCHAGWVAEMPALRSCKRVVRETGAVTAFSWRGKALNEAEIAECNTKAKA